MAPTRGMTPTPQALRHLGLLLLRRRPRRLSTVHRRRARPPAMVAILGAAAVLLGGLALSRGRRLDVRPTLGVRHHVARGRRLCLVQNVEGAQEETANDEQGDHHHAKHRVAAVLRGRAGVGAVGWVGGGGGLWRGRMGSGSTRGESMHTVEDVYCAWVLCMGAVRLHTRGRGECLHTRGHQTNASYFDQSAPRVPPRRL